MLKTVKKISTIIVIALLFAFFSFSLVDLVYQEPKYNDFCIEKPISPVPVTKACDSFVLNDSDFESCSETDGNIEYIYDSNGCPVDFKCSMCQKNLEDSRKTHRLVSFIITSIMGLIAVLVGLYSKSKDVVAWIFSGFLIGGIISIFFGTIIYFGDLNRFLKPIVLLAEMALIIWIALKTTRK